MMSEIVNVFYIINLNGIHIGQVPDIIEIVGRKYTNIYRDSTKELFDISIESRKKHNLFLVPVVEYSSVFATYDDAFKFLQEMIEERLLNYNNVYDKVLREENDRIERVITSSQKLTRVRK